MIASAFLKRLITAGLATYLLSMTAQAATINLDAGYLRGQNGTTLNTTTGGGALLLLVVSGATKGQAFTTPSAGQYVAGGDQILAGMNTGGMTYSGLGFNDSGDPNQVGLQNGGTGQETLNALTSVAIPITGIASSAYIELRWYPSITLAAYNAGATPIAGSYYGVYNPLIINPSGTNTINQDGGDAWQLPGSSDTIYLNFFTKDDQSGSQAVNEGYANFMVAIPEPPSGVMGGLSLVVLGATHLRRRLKV